ncbi:MAG: ribonuclease G [Betaproteobacteria bacterium]|nr:ribonuclease G [Betaproteobacteria bacterium]
MSDEILVNITPQETRVAVLAAGQVQELVVEREANRGLVGNIYVGRIARVLPGLQSAFVEIGLERAAFLHVADLWEQRTASFNGREPRKTSSINGGENGKLEPPKAIEKMLAEGQPVTVQVLKDPLGTKGARLSTQLSVAGRLLVYLPQDPHIGISQRIEDEAGRAALRENLKKLIPADEQGGFILRTLAEGASDDELRADIEYLRKLWRDIQQRSGGVNAGVQPPKLVYQGLSLAQRVLRDLVTDSTSAVQVDSRENHQKLVAFAQAYMPALTGKLQHYTGERPLFELYNVEQEIEKALARRVDLKSGGTLVIDQTEAMTTVDVNTGGFVGQRNFADTVFKTNLEAAQAIARQLRLRNLGGIIVVDFIDMDTEHHRATVLEELKRALAHDRTRTTMSGFTALGLVEMTRKRTRESLAHVLCEACQTCGGRGEVKTARTVCYEVLRELLREARAFKAREFRVLASQSVCDLFHEEESGALAMLSDFIGKPVSLQVETDYMQEQYDIVLL